MWWEKLGWSWSSLTIRIRNQDAFSRLCFSCISPSFSHTGVQLSSSDSSMTTDSGPVWHLTFQHSDIPSLAPNAQIPGKKLHITDEIRCPSPGQLPWLGQVRCVGLLVCVNSCSASTIAISERRGWGQCLGVEDSPIDFFSGNLAKSKWH